MFELIKDYYEMNLKDKKGQFLKFDELDLGYLETIKGFNILFINKLIEEGKMKLYYGIHANSLVLEKVKDKIGKVTLYNEEKNKNIVLDGKSIKDEEDFKNKIEKALEDYQKHVEETTQQAEVKIVRDEFLLLPSNVIKKEYRRVVNTIKEEGSMIYGELIFIEIL